MLHFTNTTGSHNKFWEISILVNSTHNRAVGYETRWGKIGCNGQRKEKPCNDFDLSGKIRDLITSKLNKGYQYNASRSTIQNGSEDGLRESLYQLGLIEINQRWPQYDQALDQVRRAYSPVENIRVECHLENEKEEERPIEEIIEEREMDRFTDLLE